MAPIGAARAARVGVLDAIPDSEDLYARYDLSQNDGTLPIVDQTGNGRDLGNGQFRGVGVTINGVQAGEFDNTQTDRANGSYSVSLSPPYHIVVAFEVVSASTTENENFYDADTANNATLFNNGAGDNDYDAFSSSSRIDTDIIVSAGDIVVSSVGFDGSSSLVRINQTETTGTLGVNDLDGFTIAARGDETNGNADIKFGEARIYTTIENVAGREQSLIDKWGPVGLS